MFSSLNMQTSVQQFIIWAGGSNLGGGGRALATWRPQRPAQIINNGGTINWFTLAAGVVYIRPADGALVQEQTWDLCWIED